MHWYPRVYFVRNHLSIKSIYLKGKATMPTNSEIKYYRRMSYKTARSLLIFTDHRQVDYTTVWVPPTVVEARNSPTELSVVDCLSSMLQLMNLL